MTTRTDRYTKAIREYVSEVYPADTDTARTIATATYDLYYGPTGAYEPDGDGWVYPGFETACDIILGYLDTLPSRLYVELDTDYVLESEPEWGEDDDGHAIEPEPCYEYDRKDIARAILGTLADYL